MKKEVIILILAFVIFGCNQFLEEETFSQLTPENAFDSPEGAQKALNGAYAMLQDGFDRKWSAGLGVLGTDEATSYNDIYTDHEVQLDKYSYSSEYDIFQAVYTDLFEGVKRCNVVIEQLPESLSAREVMIGQAKFLRGVYYFELVNLFGKVPLWLTSSADKDHLELPQSPVDEIYNQIVIDLTEAELVLPSKAVYDEGKATQYAAQAMLARVYLQMLDYENALKYCNKVIDSGEFGLYSDYAKIFDPEHKNEGVENIFEIQHRISYLSENEGSTINDFYLPIELQGTSLTGWSMYGPSEYLYNSYDPDDKRFEVTFITTGTNSAGQTVNFKPHCFKYHNRLAGIPVNDGEQNFPLIRYADILLMKAEAINELTPGNSDKFQCINEIRERAGIDLITSEGINSTKEGFLKTLLEERMHEFCFEKMRKRDLIRTGKLQEYVSERKPERPVPAKAMYYYPLPLSAIDANPLLIQLEGY